MLFTYYQILNGLLNKYKDKIRFTSKLIEMRLDDGEYHLFR